MIPGPEIVPLISKAEHLLGRKLLSLELKWGETVTVELLALGWKALHKLSTLAAAHKLDFADHAHLLIKDSLGQVTDPAGNPMLLPGNLIDHLEASSAAKLQQFALALSLGEKSVRRPSDQSDQSDASSPNAQPPALLPTPAPATTSGSPSVSSLPAPSSNPAGPQPYSTPGALPSSPSSTVTTAAASPNATSANS